MKLTKFRLTIGENWSPWGKQRVLVEKESENAFEFIKSVLPLYTINDQKRIINNGWVDAGPDTLPIAVMSFRL